MKTALPILALALAVSACGSPTPARKAPEPVKDPAAEAAELFGDGDWTLTGGKCLAILELPVNAGLPGNKAADRRWLSWLKDTVGAATAARMADLNTPTLETTPQPTLVAAATYCRNKIDEVAPQTPPAS